MNTKPQQPGIAYKDSEGTTPAKVGDGVGFWKSPTVAEALDIVRKRVAAEAERKTKA